MGYIGGTLVGAAGAFKATACGSSIYMAEDNQKDEIMNVMLFEPVSKIETIIWL